MGMVRLAEPAVAAAVPRRGIPGLRLFSMTSGLQRATLIFGLALIGLFVVVAVFAPLIAPYGFAQISSHGVDFVRQQAPSAQHWFGTSVRGEDVFSRVVFGARTALLVIVISLVLSLFIGVPLGLVSGYVGGWLDRVLVLFMDAIYAFPTLLLAIVVSIVVAGGNSSSLGGMLSAAVAITVIYVPQYFRVVRNATVAVKTEPYVDAARVTGAPIGRILFRHIFPNVTQSLPVILTLNGSDAILTLAALGFLGYGIEPTQAAEWGYDLNKALADVSDGIWWTGVFPGVAIVLVVLGMTLVGESLNEVLNPLLRTRRAAADGPGIGGKNAGAAEIAGVEGAAEQGAESNSAEVVAAVDDAVDEVKGAAALSIESLSVTFATDAGAVNAVDDVSYEVYPGEVLAIVGESGSGKSVSSRTAMGLLPRTARVRGLVTVGSRAITSMSEKQLTALRGGEISMVFQEPGAALDPLFTVGFQICEALRAHTDLSRRAAKTRAVELLRMVGLPDPEHRVNFYPHQLSGGQKQRVMIAIAIACEPKVIIADEPTTALDVTVQAEILELLRDLRDRIGSAIVLITHNMGVVADLADRVVVMREGRVVETAPVHELFAAPTQQYTRDLLAAVPHLGAGLDPGAGPVSPIAPRSDSLLGSGRAADEQDTDAQAAEPPTGEEVPAAGGRTEPVGGVAAATVVETVLEVRDLVVEFPGALGRPSFRAVDTVSLTIGRGETLGLVGESGSGKTTIGRCVAGLQRPTSGVIRIQGQDLTGLSERKLRPVRKRLGFVFQDPATSLNPRLTVGQCVAEPLVVHRAANGEVLRSRVRGLLDAVQLPAGAEDRYPHELSGGQRQRASLARALVLNPDLLIADEPTSALDVSVQATVLELFADLQREFGWACLFISHDLAVVDQLAARIMVLRNGCVVEQGTRDEILRRPAQEYTRRLVAAVPVPDPVEQRRRRAASAALFAADHSE